MRPTNGAIDANGGSKRLPRYLGGYEIEAALRHKFRFVDGTEAVLFQ